MARKKGSASESLLEALHKATAEFMLNQIEAAMAEDPDDDSGIGAFMGTGDMSNILKFLKDNNITAAPDDVTLDKLKSEFTNNEEFLNARAAKADSIIKGTDTDQYEFLN